MKKVFIIIGCILLALLVLIGGAVAMVSVMFSQIPHIKFPPYSDTTQTVSIDNDVACVRLRVDVYKGTQITAAHLEIISVPDYSLPAGVYRTAADVIGKYATSQLYAGDYLTPGKISDIATTIEDTTLGEGKQVMSVQISSFAGSLSGRLQSGDIVSFWVKNENGEPYVPEELQYVKVVTITTGSGIDKDQIIINDDGSFAMPSTVTVVVSHQQAARLVACSGESMYLTLVCRGNEEQAQKYLDMQDEILEEIQVKTP